MAAVKNVTLAAHRQLCVRVAPFFFFFDYIDALTSAKITRPLLTANWLLYTVYTQCVTVIGSDVRALESVCVGRTLVIIIHNDRCWQWMLRRSVCRIRKQFY